MGLLSNIFKKKAQDSEGGRVGGIEDFMTLIRVYFQASMAANIGITNISMLPDLRVFKQTLHVATVNNRLGLGEKTKCRKMLGEIYGMPDSFFHEIDASVKTRCRKVNDVTNYLYQFQGFSQDLLMLMGNVLKWKFRMPSFFKKTIRAVIERSVNDVLTKNDWKDAGVMRTCAGIRKYRQSLGYSPQWMTEYVYHLVMLAKKEPRPKDVPETDKK